MTKDEAWEMIDSALEHCYCEKDVLTIKEALAQPEQEPVVAWMTAYGNIMHAKGYSAWLRFDGGKGRERFSDYTIPLFATPPKRQPLTEERINLVTVECFGPNADLDFHCHHARAIEAAHDIKE